MNLDDLKKELKRLLDNQNSTDSMNIDNVLNKLMQDMNSAKKEDFEGYSSMEMQQIIHFLFDENCPIRIKKLKSEDVTKIPVYNGVKFLVNYLLEHEKIKLTAKGFLPTKIVADLYNQKYFLEEKIEIGVCKLRTEMDSIFVNICHLLLVMSGYGKKVNRSLTLTAKGKKNTSDHQSFFEDLLKAYCVKFNWGYFDYYEMFDVAKLGNGYSIFLLNKYGNEKRDSNFYVQKYFTAFPMFMEDVNVRSMHQSKEEYLSNCYSLRTFKRFGKLFGLIHIDKNINIMEPNIIQKTELFDAIFECLTPEKNK
jgi:hypothetical protein